MTLGTFKVMLQGTIIRNDDFLHNTALQCWSNVATFRNIFATMCCAKNRRCKSFGVVFFVYSQIIDTPDSLIVHLFHKKH